MAALERPPLARLMTTTEPPITTAKATTAMIVVNTRDGQMVQLKSLPLACPASLHTHNLLACCG